MAAKVVIDTQHSEFGPSAADRWIPCPGSVLASRGVEDPDSWFAAEGNAAHELSEWCRVHKKYASTYRGQIIVVGKFEFTVDQEMIDGVNEFVEYCEQWPGHALYEERVDYEPWVPGGFGTLDDGRLQDYVCRITDLKYGMGIKRHARGNPQLLLYALGTYYNYRWLYTFKSFILTIHQPRLNHVDTWEISLDDLLHWADTVAKPTAEIASKPGAPFKAGDHCVFCPIRRTCRVRAQHLLDDALGAFNEPEDGPLPLSLLTNKEVATIVAKKSNWMSWLKDLESHVCAQVKSGIPVTHPEYGDYKFVEGRSNRVFAQSEEATVAALRKHGATDDQLYEKSLRSPAKLEKIVGKKVMADLIRKPPGRPKLALGNDPRPAINVDPLADFENMEEE